MNIMNRKLVLSLLPLIISSFPISGEELIYYTTYESNSGELCHGLHVGDVYKYEEYSGIETHYENGSIHYYISPNPSDISIEITKVPNEEEMMNSYPRYSYNSIFNDGHSSSSGSLSYVGSELDFFLYLDWDAWRNMYNNITIERIDLISRLKSKDPSGNHFYEYRSMIEKETTADYSYLFEVQDGINFGSYSYNKSDGSIISTWKSHLITDGSRGARTTLISKELYLVSKKKVSEEIVCVARLTDSATSDNNPGMNPIFLVLIIPISQMKRSFRYRI